MFLTEGASTSNFKLVTDLSLYHPKSSNKNYAGRDLPTPDVKDEKDSVSVDKHMYIILELIFKQLRKLTLTKIATRTT